jgi:hypothetical protein
MNPKQKKAFLGALGFLGGLGANDSQIYVDAPNRGPRQSFILDFGPSGRFTTGPTMNALLSIPTLSLALLGLMLTCAG